MTGANRSYHHRPFVVIISPDYSYPYLARQSDTVTYTVGDELLVDQMNDVRANAVHEVLRMRHNQQRPFIPERTNSYVLR